VIFGGRSACLSTRWRPRLEAYPLAHIQVTGFKGSQLRVCCGTFPANRDQAAERPLADLVHLSRRKASSGKKAREVPQMPCGRAFCGWPPSHPDRSSDDPNRCGTHLIRLPFGAPPRTRNWRIASRSRTAMPHLPLHLRGCAGLTELAWMRLFGSGTYRGTYRATGQRRGQ
jgi:hypothetical protein